MKCHMQFLRAGSNRDSRGEKELMTITMRKTTTYIIGATQDFLLKPPSYAASIISPLIDFPNLYWVVVSMPFLSFAFEVRGRRDVQCFFSRIAFIHSTLFIMRSKTAVIAHLLFRLGGCPELSIIQLRRIMPGCWSW